MRSISDIWRFAVSAPEPAANLPAPPSPYQVALTLAAALLQSGKYEGPDAAIIAAWWAVPSYYHGANTYVREIAPALIFGLSAAPDEGVHMHNTEMQGV